MSIEDKTNPLMESLTFLIRKRYLAAFQMLHAKYASTCLGLLDHSELNQTNSFADLNNTTSFLHPSPSFNALNDDQSLLSNFDPKNNNLVMKKSSSMENSMINNFFRFEMSNSQKMILNVLELGKDNPLEEEYVKNLEYVSESEDKGDEEDEEEEEMENDEGRRAPRGTLFADGGDSGIHPDFLTMKFKNTQDNNPLFQSTVKDGIFKDNIKKGNRRFTEFGMGGPTRVYKDKKNQVITSTLRSSLRLMAGQELDLGIVEGNEENGKNKKFFSELAKNKKLRDATIKKIKEKQEEDMLDSIIKRKSVGTGKKFGNFYTPLPKKNNNFGNVDFIEEEDESYDSDYSSAKEENYVIEEPEIIEEEDSESSLDEDEIEEDESLGGFSDSLEVDEDVDLITSKSHSDDDSMSDFDEKIKRRSTLRRVSIIDTKLKNAEIQKRRSELETAPKRRSGLATIEEAPEKSKRKLRRKNQAKSTKHEINQSDTFKSERSFKNFKKKPVKVSRYNKARKVSQSLHLNNENYDFSNYVVEDMKEPEEVDVVNRESKETLRENYSFTADGLTDLSMQVNQRYNNPTVQEESKNTETDKELTTPKDSTPNDSFDTNSEPELRQLKQRMKKLKESKNDFSLVNNEVSFDSYDKSIDFSEKLNLFYNNAVNDGSIDFLKKANVAINNPNSNSINSFKHARRGSNITTSEMDAQPHFTFANKSVDNMSNNVSQNFVSFGKGKNNNMFDSSKKSISSNHIIFKGNNKFYKDSSRRNFAKKTSRPEFEVIMETEMQENWDSKDSFDRKNHREIEVCQNEFGHENGSLSSPKRLKKTKGKGSNVFLRQSLADSVNSLRESINIESVLCRMERVFESTGNKHKQLVFLLLQLNNYNPVENKAITTFSILNKTKNVKLRNAFDCVYKFCVNNAKFQIFFQKMANKYSKNNFLEKLDILKNFKCREDERKKKIKRKTIQKVELKLFVATFQHIKRNKMFEAFTMINMQNTSNLEEIELFRNSNVHQIGSLVASGRIQNKNRFKRRSTLDVRNINKIKNQFVSQNKKAQSPDPCLSEKDSQNSQDSLAEEADLIIIEAHSNDSNLKDLKKPCQFINSPSKSRNIISISNPSVIQSGSYNAMNSPLNFLNIRNGEIPDYSISKNSIFSYKDSMYSALKSNNELLKSIRKFRRFLETTAGENEAGLLKRLNDIIQIVMNRQGKLDDRELYSLKIALKQLMDGLNIEESQMSKSESMIKEKSLILSGLLKKVESNRGCVKTLKRIRRNKRSSLFSLNERNLSKVSRFEEQDFCVFLDNFLRTKRTKNIEEAFTTIVGGNSKNKYDKFIAQTLPLTRKKEIEAKTPLTKETDTNEKDISLKRTTISTLIRRYRIKTLKAIRKLVLHKKKQSGSSFTLNGKDFRSSISLSNKSDYMSTNTLNNRKTIVGTQRRFTLYKNRNSQRESVCISSTASMNKLIN